jgi:DNA-binding Lrp family transcriptional regulator
MRTESASIIAEMRRQLDENGYYIAADIIDKFPVTSRALNAGAVADFKKEEDIVHVWAGVSCRRRDLEYVQSLKITRRIFEELTEAEIESRILDIKKEFTRSALHVLLGKINQEKYEKVLNDLVNRGLVGIIGHRLGAKLPDGHKSCYYVVDCPTLIGGMAVLDPPTRPLDRIRRTLLAHKQYAIWFTLEDLARESEVSEASCRPELTRLIRGGFIMKNDQLKGYEFIK